MDNNDLLKPPQSHEIIYCGSTFEDKLQELFLYRNNRSLSVQLELCWTTKDGSLTEWELETEHAVRILQPHLDELPFGKYDSVRVLRNRTGRDWQIKPCRRHGAVSFRYLEPVPWNLLQIDENEVKITRFFTFEYFSGNWNGTPVDLFKPWHTWSWTLMENDLNGYQLVEGIGFVYRLLGLLTRQGRVIGYITEPKRGRAVQWGDRAKVYAAIASLQRERILCRGWDHQQVTITASGVRFLNPSCFQQFSPDQMEELGAEAAKKHWTALEEYFDQLKHGAQPEPIFWNMNPTGYVVPRAPTMQRLYNPGWAQCAPDLIYTLYLRMNYNSVSGIRRHRIIDRRREKEGSRKPLEGCRRREPKDVRTGRRSHAHLVSPYEVTQALSTEKSSEHDPRPNRSDFSISRIIEGISFEREQHTAQAVDAFTDAQSSVPVVPTSELIPFEMTFSPRHASDEGQLPDFEREQQTAQAVDAFMALMAFITAQSSEPVVPTSELIPSEISLSPRYTPDEGQLPDLPDLFGDYLYGDVPMSPSTLSTSSTLVSSPFSATKAFDSDGLEFPFLNTFAVEGNLY